ncbi:hypothetical protein, partial [Anaerosolibacter sp.]|uniref:hypothetical protein n=1 Tax=Anaerosolibacter sp. TaxID=1872527 RepID=UPI0039EE4E9A
SNEGSSCYIADYIMMELHIFLKTQTEPVIYKGDRIDVLDFEMNGIKYKQIRYFRKGFSKSELVEDQGISKIVRK